MRIHILIKIFITFEFIKSFDNYLIINTKKNTYSENVKQIEIYNEVYKSIYQILINHYDNIINFLFYFRISRPRPS